jgi:hypothetical protein
LRRLRRKPNATVAYRPDRAGEPGGGAGPKHVVKTGKTAVLDAKEWPKLLDSIPTVSSGVITLRSSTVSRG